MAEEYGKKQIKKILFAGGLFLAVLLLFIIGVGVGSSDLPFTEGIRAFFGSGSESALLIVRKVRVLRMLSALVVGGSLALSGCAMQTVLENPLASPSTLGVSNGGVFGACLSVICFSDIAVASGVLSSLFAFFFGLLSAIAVLLFSSRNRHSPDAVVLCGVALGSLFSAGSAVLQTVATDTERSETVFWQTGDLGRVTYNELAFLSLLFLLCFILFFLLSKTLNALQTGEETAHSLGISVRKMRLLFLLLSSLLTSACVSKVGLIGFIGLVAPHIGRKIVGCDHRFLLPVSALIGSIFLMTSDIVARATPLSLSVGAVTALLGSPLFLWIVLSRRRNHVAH